MAEDKPRAGIGWEAWFDPDFCELRCPVCTRARKGYRLARLLQAIEMAVTFGGCPWCRARQRKYGVPPNKPIPPSIPQTPGST